MPEKVSKNYEDKLRSKEKIIFIFYSVFIIIVYRRVQWIRAPSYIVRILHNRKISPIWLWLPELILRYIRHWLLLFLKKKRLSFPSTLLITWMFLNTAAWAPIFSETALISDDFWWFQKKTIFYNFLLIFQKFQKYLNLRYIIEFSVQAAKRSQQHKFNISIIPRSDSFWNKQYRKWQTARFTLFSLFIQKWTHSRGKPPPSNRALVSLSWKPLAVWLSVCHRSAVSLGCVIEYSLIHDFVAVIVFSKLVKTEHWQLELSKNMPVKFSKHWTKTGFQSLRLY